MLIQYQFFPSLVLNLLNFKYKNIFTFQYLLLMMKLNFLFYTTHVLNDQGKMTENDTDVCTVLLKFATLLYKKS